MATYGQEPGSSGSNAGFSSRQTNARKRERYVLHACDRCRAAKVRCNGALPCSYCGMRAPDACHYSAPRFPQEPHREAQPGVGDIGHISALIEQQNSKLDLVLKRVSALEELHSHHVSSKPDGIYSWAKEPLPLFQSPSSADFSICIVDANLRADQQSNTGSSASEESNSMRPPTSFSILRGQIVNDNTCDAADGNSAASVGHTAKSILDDAPDSSGRPLDNLEGHEILRLVHLYQDFAGMMYPMVDVAYMEQRVRDLWMSDTGQGAEKCRSDQLSRNDLVTLHIMVAIGLVVENENGSTLVQSLHDSLWPYADSMVWNTRVDLDGLILLTLMSLYYYYTNEWRVAWRLVGNIARIILELGLNRQIALNRSFPDRELHARAVNTVWTVFMLEQQLSYALGLPAAINDLQLESDFPRPVEAPYLEAMVQYARIGAQAVETLRGEKSAGPAVSNCQELFSYIQYRIEQWRKAIATRFQFPSTSERAEKWNSKLRTFLNLRANNLHIVISRCILFENGVQGAAPLDLWDSSVGVAADTSQLLARMDNSPATSHFEKSRSNYFLIAALGLSFLAISQSQSPPISASFVSNPALMAPTTYAKAQQTAMLCLNLLRVRAESSRQSLRLWERVRGLASRLNLSGLPRPMSTPRSTEGGPHTMQTPGVDEFPMNQAGMAEKELLQSLGPIVPMDLPNQGEQTQDLASILGMVPGFDLTYDTVHLGNGFAE